MEAKVSIEAATSGTGSAVTRAAVAAAVAMLVVLLASGCVGGSPSSVAYVGPDRITQRQLDTALAGVQSTLGQSQQVSPQAVVSVLIQGAIATQIAAQRGITITDAQRDALLAESNLQPLLADPAATQVAYDIADQQLVASAVGTEAYLRDLQATDVELNPRFGVLDPATKAVVDGQSSSLSLPSSVS